MATLTNTGVPYIGLGILHPNRRYGETEDEYNNRIQRLLDEDARVRQQIKHDRDATALHEDINRRK